MVKTEEQHRRAILDFGKLIYQKGWLAANAGNISVRPADCDASHHFPDAPRRVHVVHAPRWLPGSRWPADRSIWLCCRK